MADGNGSPTRQDVVNAIQSNQARLMIPGVTSVRPGWHFENDWITRQRAIVVKALRDNLANVQANLPPQVDGIPVDVRRETRKRTLGLTNPNAFAALMTGPRIEFREAEFSDEIFAPETETALAAAAARAPKAAKPQIDYTAPKGVTLDEVEEDMSIILHASPDAGWSELRAFLSDVESELVVGMYDFTARHILEAVESGLGGRKLTLTLDHPGRNPHADLSDEETFAALSQTLGEDFEFAWALTKPDPRAPVWIYPFAYHIKVAVKDEAAFWLSSGNWNRSNQPEIDLTDPQAAAEIARNSDRDWHVICTSKSLIKTFRAFLENDFNVAFGEEAKPRTVSGPVVALASAPVKPEIVPAVAARAPAKFFAPKTISGTIRVQPLLTPDPGSYQPHVLALIRSASERFYMQTQYIHPSADPADQPHQELIAAVAEKINAGVDVRLITSEFQDHDWIEKLQDAGVDAVDHLRIQPHVHNKGIIVDLKAVVVSSQNWSSAGTLHNRDAGVIIFDEAAVRYFADIFLHDWEQLAARKALM